MDIDFEDIDRRYWAIIEKSPRELRNYHEWLKLHDLTEQEVSMRRYFWLRWEC